MTQQLEDMIRTAFREKAAQIPAVAPALDLEASPQVVRPAAGRSAWSRPARRKLLAGLASAAAVTAVAVGTVLASAPTAPPKQAPASAVLGQVPPYYVALASGGPNSGRIYAIVRATRTGAVIARIPVPRPYTGFQGVTGAADDRTFVLEADDPAQSAPPGTPGVRFYLLRIAPTASLAADRARLTPLRADLPLTAYTYTSAMALSPDGAKLAVVANEARGNAPRTENRIVVFNLVTGSSHAWLEEGCNDNCIINDFVISEYSQNTISWTADGHELGFVQFTGNTGFEQFRLLDVDAAGSSVLADSRPVTLRTTAGALNGVTPGDTQWQASLVTPDGKSIIIDAATGSVGKVEQTLLRYSTGTGALTAVLGVRPPFAASRTTMEQVPWTSPDGSTILVTDYRGTGSAGVLRDGRYIPIPWSAANLSAAW